MAFTQNDQLLAEAYIRLTESVTYTLPSSPKTLMSDFYVLNYISSINYDKLAELGNSNALRYEQDFKADVQHAESVMLPFLQKHMLDAVFFAMCAEIRHLLAREQPEDLFKRWGPFMQAFHKYYMHYSSGFGTNDPRKPDIGEYKADSRSYQESYASVIKAAKQLGYSRGRVVNFFGDAFLNGNWHNSYGGRPWANIALAWTKLSQVSPTNYQQLYVYIDHVYDLQHNTDTVFNKLKSYYLKTDENPGYSWIKAMLDFKANVKSIQELFPTCSSQMVKLARPVLKAANLLKMKPVEEPKPGYRNNAKGAQIAAFTSCAVDIVETLIIMILDDPEIDFGTKSVLEDFYKTPNDQMGEDVQLVDNIASTGADAIMEYLKNGPGNWPTGDVFFNSLKGNTDFREFGNAFAKPIEKFTRNDWIALFYSAMEGYPEISDTIKRVIKSNAKKLKLNLEMPEQSKDFKMTVAKAMITELEWYINVIREKNPGHAYKDYIEEIRTFYFNSVDLDKTAFGKHLAARVAHKLGTHGNIQPILDVLQDHVVVSKLKSMMKANLANILGIGDSNAGLMSPASFINSYVAHSVHTAVTRLMGIYLKIKLDSAVDIAKHGQTDPIKSIAGTYFNTNNSGAANADIVHSQLIQILIHDIAKDFAHRPEFLNELCYMDGDTIITPLMSISLKEIKAQSPQLARIIKSGKHNYSAAILKDYFAKVVESDSGQLNTYLCKIIAEYRKPLNLDLQIGGKPQASSPAANVAANVASTPASGLNSAKQAIDSMHEVVIPAIKTIIHAGHPSLLKSAMAFMKFYPDSAAQDLKRLPFVQHIGDHFNHKTLQNMYDYGLNDYMANLYTCTLQLANQIQAAIDDIQN